ncbi:MAG TPA: hypothetical protein VJ963_04790, partial [Bacteroidales bacterium]|nr:hypothetical protein [Bacteroidales bacterium]
MDNRKKIKRREFINKGVRLGIGVGMGVLALDLSTRNAAGKTIWQIDPSKCVQCDKCSTDCVLETSAVKCVHV